MPPDFPSVLAPPALDPQGRIQEFFKEGAKKL